MKRVLFILVILFLTINKLESHSGRTDSDGGHHNRKTGGYHYHGVKSGRNWVFLGVIVIGFILFNLSKNKKK